MLHKLKQFIPEPLLSVYHFVLAKLAVLLYNNPSKKLIVIGVTGTNGKSSTTQFVAQLLTEMGKKVGYTTTAGFSIAGREIENRMKMTMPGRFYLQRLLRDMVRAGCTHAVIETSSQGLIQFRHIGLNYDVAVFTNLTPEHIEAHGGFDAYKKAKGILFEHLTNRPRKTIKGKLIPKVIVANTDDEHASYYLEFSADKYITFSWSGKPSENHLVGSYKKQTLNETLISVNKEETQLFLHAAFQHKNALAAIATVVGVGESLHETIKAVHALKPIAGRFEFINAEQPFLVIVDYAYEPYAIQALLDGVKALRPKRIIGVHGSAGGGRDIARRHPIGFMAGTQEDVVVVTNEDPYDENPRKIIEDVAQGVKDAGKKEGVDLFLVDSRIDGIYQAIAEAKEGDIVILTGKGSDPVMAVENGKSIPWSDKEAALLALSRLGYTKHA